MSHLPRLLATTVVVASAVVIAACEPPLPPPPRPPSVEAVPSPTNIARQLLRGTKQASTGVKVGDDVLVPLDAEVTWSAFVDLEEGANVLALTTFDGADQESEEATPVIVTVDTEPPDPPELTPLPPRTLKDVAVVSGDLVLGNRAVVNGAVVPGLADEGTFTKTIELALGDNPIRVASRDIAGNESDVLALNIERLDGMPFTVDSVPARVSASATVSGTRGPGVEVSRLGTVIAAADDVGGAWSAPLVLNPGANTVTLRAELVGEPDTGVDVVIETFLDDTTPTLTLAAPADGDIAGGLLRVAGSFSDDDPGSVVQVCAGPCTDDADFITLGAAGGSFAEDVDISGRVDLVDGDAVDVVVRVTDGAGNTASTTVTVFLARDPITLAGPPGTTTTVDAAGSLPGPVSFAWRNSAGALGVTIDDTAGALTPATSTIASLPAIATAPSIARDDARTLVAWLEDGGAATSTAGQPGVVTALLPGGAATVLSPGDVDAATSVDTAFLNDGTAVVAWSQGADVLVAFESGASFGAPVVVSDATTAEPSGVSVAISDDDRVTVSWREISDRDGAADDADVVAARVDPALGVIGTPLLVSRSGGTFADGESGAPSTAALAGSAHPVAVGFVDGGEGWIATVVDDDFTNDTAPVPLEATAVTGGAPASSMALASSGSTLAVAWVDTATTLLVRRVVGGTPGSERVLAENATSPTLTLAGSTATVAWIEGGDVLVFPVELP